MCCRVCWKVVLMTPFLMTWLVAQGLAQPPDATPNATQTLVVGNDAGKTITLSLAEFAQLPRTTLQVKAPHSEEMVQYEGVLLYELLQKAGVRFVDRSTPKMMERILPGTLRTSYVLMEAADGYRIVYSVAEIHPDLGGRRVLLADRQNGQPLDAKAAPFQVINAASELHGRWIRQVTRILVQPAARRAVEGLTLSREALSIGNETGKVIRLTPAEFAQLPRTVIQDKVPHHDDLMVSYEGVLLHELLRKAGVQFEDPEGAAKGERRVPPALRTAYVLMEAADGYQVVFSIPEIHPDLGGRRVLVADRVNGQPLADDARPYRVIVAGGELHEVWIRQVTGIFVQSASLAPAGSSAAPRTSPEDRATPAGRLYLVGTGPGDPELITVKAAGVLRSADVVFCFSWLDEELARFVQPGRVEVVSPLFMGGRYFGQKPEDVSAELREAVVEANAELATFKRRVEQMVTQGKTVVLADNGDPMVFSPWSWAAHEFAYLQPIVVPGVSSFNAANAALKSGVTGSGSITLSSSIDTIRVDHGGRLSGTLVFFTHQKKLQDILPALQTRYPADTPVAIVCDVSYPTERVLRGTLGDIGQTIGAGNLPQLYLFYVGDGLRQSGCCP